MRGVCGALLLVLCLAAIRGEPEPAPRVADTAPHSPRPRRQASTAADHILRKINEFRQAIEHRSGSEGGHPWALQSLPVELPLRDGAGRSSSLPVLLLPVPVPVSDNHDKFSVAEGKPGVSGGNAERGEEEEWRPARPSLSPPRRVVHRRPLARPDPVPHYDAPPSVYPHSYPRFSNNFSELAPGPATFKAKVSSQQLVQQFREQKPSAPHLPPAIFPIHSGDNQPPPSLPLPDKLYVPSAARPNESSGDPPRPQFDRSLLIRAELTVPRADFTEPYTAWWDAESGATRVDFHGGATTTYSKILPDGRVQHLERRVERSGARPLRRCWQSAPAQPAAADRAPPALPDMQLFSFAGYEEAEGGRVEQWQHAVSGRGGELGGAPGEALTFRHQMLLRRDNRTQLAIPIKYVVSVDSSVLGAECDGHEHRYLQVRSVQHDPQLFSFDAGAWCERLDLTDDMSRLAPLREFTSPQRDLRYDQAIDRYKQEFGREYRDRVEEAVRKNLFVQSTRFVLSGNRMGGTFELGVNLFADHLDFEMEPLFGVSPGVDHIPAESFPHTVRRVQRARRQRASSDEPLPDQFDWRPLGAVSHVRFQGFTCASCWAIAVTGAVEGALFVKTRRLVPLSEQALVDCAHTYGGNGCRGTWPSHAYDYIQDRGLPALDHYTPYTEKVVECRDDSVSPVTHISAHVDVTRNSVPALKVAIRKHAPTVVIIDGRAKSFIFYKTGVLYDDRCGKSGAKALNHAVLAVGWGEQERAPHFILKNSWGTKWGEEGYIRVQGPANTCGVLSQPSYPRLETDDVDRPPSAAGSGGPASEPHDNHLHY